MRLVAVGICLVWLISGVFSTVHGQDSVWELMPTPSTASLRGLHVLDAETIWASGSQGTVIHSNNQGREWQVRTIPGAETLDVRDLHVFDKQNILAMTSGTPARLYRTDDAGVHWKMVFESNDPRVFLDSIAFVNNKSGLVMGDPVEGRLFLLHSQDAGWTWKSVTEAPMLEIGEAGFAASGTNMTVINDTHWAIGLGGDVPFEPSDLEDSENRGAKNNQNGSPKYSRIVIVDAGLEHWRIVDTPMRRHESGGIFSLVFVDSHVGIAVGGDYKEPEFAKQHIATTIDGGATWTIPTSGQQPTGFRSCVAIRPVKDNESTLIAVGTNGTDVSSDLGQTWRRVSDLALHSVQFSPDGRCGWGVGSHGKIAKWKMATD
jgi:photosystem II stability/assembly factor-like uncharacterized protein